MLNSTTEIRYVRWRAVQHVILLKWYTAFRRMPWAPIKDTKPMYSIMTKQLSWWIQRCEDYFYNKVRLAKYKVLNFYTPLLGEGIKKVFFWKREIVEVLILITKKTQLF
jgi:hypothetical protein